MKMQKLISKISSKNWGSNIGNKICDEIESYLKGLIKIKEGEKCVQ